MGYMFKKKSGPLFILPLPVAFGWRQICRAWPAGNLLTSVLT